MAATSAVVQQLVPDDLEADQGSSYGAELSSYTTSLSSGVTDYEWEHGRRFHKYKEGRYPWPNDESEQARLDLNHHVLTILMDGKLYLAPVKQPKRVIDLATGTGIWAIDFADEHPDVELVLGNDLSPIQPSWVPPNVKFVVDDVESEWSYEKPFDFIHGRYLAGSISDWPKLMSQAYANLQSGGWVEFQDYDLNVRVDDNSLDGTVVAQLHDLICGACEKLGRTAAPGPKLKGWVEGAGFDNVKEVVYKLPLGPWTKDAKLKHAGGLNLSQCLSGLEAFTLRLFTSVLGWTTDEIHAFLVDARRDLNLKRIHPYMTFHVVYAQKR